MAGSLQVHTAGGAQDYGDEAIWTIQGTGTANDGKRVRGRAIVGGDGGILGTLQAPVNTLGRAQRSAFSAYRTGITAADLIANPAALASITGQTIGGGVLAFGTTYNVSYAPGNRYGPAKASTAAGQAPGGSNNALRVPVPQSTGAEWYDLFLSTAANPLWVARITETQRAAGCQVTAVGAVGAGGVAGSVDILVVGTGLANNNAIFTNNNAFIMPGAAAIDVSNYATLKLSFELSVADLRSAPSVSYTILTLNDVSGNRLQTGGATTITPLGGVFAPLMYEVNVTNLNGASSVHVLIAAIAGQGAAVDIAYARA